METAAEGLKKMAGSAVPVVTRLEKPGSARDSQACSQHDELKEKCPFDWLLCHVVSLLWISVFLGVLFFLIPWVYLYSWWWWCLCLGLGFLVLHCRVVLIRIGVFLEFLFLGSWGRLLGVCGFWVRSSSFQLFLVHLFFGVLFLLSIFQVPFPVLLFVFFVVWSWSEVYLQLSQFLFSFVCLVGFRVANCLKLPANFLVVSLTGLVFVGVESWGWFFGLVLLVILLDVVVVGVGWMFVGVGLAESSCWSSLGFLLVSSSVLSVSMSISSFGLVGSSSSIRGSMSSKSYSFSLFLSLCFVFSMVSRSVGLVLWSLGDNWGLGWFG